MRWALLTSMPSGEHFTLRQIRQALEWKSDDVKIFSVISDGHLKRPEQLDRELCGWRPQRVLWYSEVGLPYYELWISEKWESIPKIDLWFDEPVTSVERFGLEGVMRLTGGRRDFFHGIWDGYWRKDAVARWGIHPKAIHLAADGNEFQPLWKCEAKRKKTLVSDGMVFIGMLHSQASIDRHLSDLPRGLNALARAAQASFDDWFAPDRKMSLEPPSWDRVWRRARMDLGRKEQILVDMEEQREREAVFRVRWAFWAMAKNRVRVEVLRRARRVAPLRIYCDQQQLQHASVAEWGSLLGKEGNEATVVDTSGITGSELARLYWEGRLHLQATDPQSVEGGIPYRVFQTAAAGRVLVTDGRPELEDCFASGKELLTFGALEQVAAVLESVYADVDRLECMGRAARGRFERDHQWIKRMDEIQGWVTEAGLS
ncbi:MAG: glycosyltransferase [Verrucomicrobiae bacterium]|nr:glycosyltransferase [Verrucomicrobiae bacterium]